MTTTCKGCLYLGDICPRCQDLAEQRADTWEPDTDGRLAAHAADRYERNVIHGGRR